MLGVLLLSDSTVPLQSYLGAKSNARSRLKTTSKLRLIDRINQTFYNSLNVNYLSSQTLGTKIEIIVILDMCQKSEMISTLVLTEKRLF